MNEASESNLNVNKQILKCQPFSHRVYGIMLVEIILNKNTEMIAELSMYFSAHCVVPENIQLPLPGATPLNF